MEDEVDEYLRNEYRAEQGAYLERRPDYARSGGREQDARSWGPRLPVDFDDYYAEEGFAGTGVALPSDEPLYRGESGFADRFRGPPAGEPWRRDIAPRPRHDPRQQDREAGRKLAHAAESFYERLAGAVGLEPHDRDQGHRGRGPRNYRRSDERILDEVGQRLTDDAYVDATDIDIAVRNQEVSLSGTVASRFEKRLAEDIAEAVAGVVHVQNNLRVRASTGPGW